MNKGKFLAMTAALIMSFSVNATIITFDYANRIHSGDNRIDTAGGGVVTASRNLYNYPDGIRLGHATGNPGNYAGGYYGEHGQYFQFDNTYFLNSLDVKLEHYGHYWAVNSINIFALDSNLSILAERIATSPIVNNWVTLNFNIANVSRILIDFTGGTNFYGQGRTHGWIGVDNINYSANAVPEPGTLALLGMGLAGMGIARRLRKG